MKSRAALAVQAGKPLEITDVNLEGPKDGEILVRTDVPIQFFTRNPNFKPKSCQNHPKTRFFQKIRFL